MFISRTLPFFALALSVTASFPWLGNGGGTDQVRLQDDDEGLAVPGANPLKYCDDPAENILEIDRVDLTPNPPEVGKTLSVSAVGILKERVEKGAYIALQVKYGVITLIKQTVDLCDQVSNIQLDCPLDKGAVTITKDVDLPNEIPPGKYTVLAHAFTKDDESITCLTAEIHFNR